MPGRPFGGARTGLSESPNCFSAPVFAETRPSGELEQRQGSGALAGRRYKIEGANVMHVIVNDEVKKRRDEERNEGRRLLRCGSAGIPSVHPRRLG